MWRIYYADGSTVDGRTEADWRTAPDDGVQIVVRFRKYQRTRWHFSKGPVRDRDLWTGTDSYDPFRTGYRKRGSLIEDDAYQAIWERACADPKP